MPMPRIFVVDDDRLLVEELTIKLEALGYGMVGSAGNATDAVEGVLQQRPDLILMDIVLEGDVDGIEAARRIKERADLPIVYLTAYANDALLARAQVTDPFGYIVKPASSRELHAVISMALYKASAERELRAKALACDSLALISDAVITLDNEGRIVLVNPAAQRFLSMPVSGALGKHWTDVLQVRAETDRSILQQIIERAADGESTLPPGADMVLLDSHSQETDISLRASPHRLPENMGVTLMFIDISALKFTERELRASERRFSDVVAAAGEFVWEVDAQWRYTYVSDRYKELMGYSDEQIISRPVSFPSLPQQAAQLDERLQAIAAIKSTFKNLEYEAMTRQGETLCLDISGIPQLDKKGDLIAYRGVGLDITQRKNAAARIEFLATRDHLTALPNRTSLFDHMKQHLAEARRENNSLAVMFVDLDNFKYINDSLGHEVGDEVLRIVAGRMASCIRGRDTLARIGGDEFVIVLGGMSVPARVQSIVTKILEALRRPCDLNGVTLHVRASVGISMFPDDGEDTISLVRYADTAMYHAKSLGRDRFQFFNKDMNDRMVERLDMENAMRRGLSEREFILHYQPKIDVRSGRLTGVEALVRWNHPQKGLLFPSDFIPLAEETGLITELGSWVIYQACRQTRAWVRSGHANFKTSVNLSLAQIHDHLPQLVQEVLRDIGLKGKSLELEVTESILMSNSELSLEVMRGIRALSVGISIDDFGTGYSSLSLLQTLPFNTLKIDQSFVRELPVKPGKEGGAIIRAIVRMAEGLHLGVIAEGVENEAQVRDLRAMECFECQGYYFGHPLPAEQFTARHLC